MKLPRGFALTAQDKPTNCAAVALRNAIEWIRCTAPPRVAARMMDMSVDDWEGDLHACDPTDGTHYPMIGWFIAGRFPLDVLHVAVEVRNHGNIEPRLRALLRAGWVLIAGIDSDYTPGHRHAIAIVGPPFTILDGKRPAPYRWSYADLDRRHVGFVLALRGSRDLYPLVGEKV